MTKPLGYPVEPGWRLMIKDLGVDARTVLRRARLPEDLLSRTGSIVRTDDYFRLWSALEAEVDAPDFAMRFNDTLRTEHFMPSLFAAPCSPDLLTAMERIAKYKRLMSPQRMTLAATRDSVTVTKTWIESTAIPPASLVLMELVFLVTLARTATREPIQPLRVTLPNPPEDSAAYATFFGVAVTKGRQPLVRFRKADALRPFLTANEAMWNTFEPELRRRLAELDETASTAERVRAALLEGLPSGRGSVDAVAATLHMSKRTLQRRLRAEDTTFHGVLQDTREELAKHYLTRTGVTSAEIAFLLGFEEPNSFFRAFQGWTGTTPEQVRAAAHA